MSSDMPDEGPETVPYKEAPTTDPYATWDAPYVLGALGPADRRTFEAHLKGCATCRRAVAEFAGLPGILGLVPKETALSVVEEMSATTNPPPLPAGMLDHTLSRVRRVRLRRRLIAVVAGIAAVAAAVAIAVQVTRVDDPSGPEPRVVAEHVMDRAAGSPLSADLKLIADPSGGTRIDLTCRYDGTGGYAGKYTMWVTGPASTAELVGWPVAPGGEVKLTAVSQLAPDQIRRVEVRSDSGAVLLTMSRDG